MADSLNSPRFAGMYPCAQISLMMTSEFSLLYAKVEYRGSFLLSETTFAPVNVSTIEKSLPWPGSSFKHSVAYVLVERSSLGKRMKNIPYSTAKHTPRTIQILNRMRKVFTNKRTPPWKLEDLASRPAPRRSPHRKIFSYGVFETSIAEIQLRVSFSIIPNLLASNFQIPSDCQRR